MIRIPRCFSCKYFIADYSEKGIYKCKAFPDGIPKEIFLKIAYDGEECAAGYHHTYENGEKND